MAGRVYLGSVLALVMAAAHVSAFYMPHFPMFGGPFMHQGFFPRMHPFGFPFAGKFGKVAAPRMKPASRPFTLADAIPGGGQFPFGSNFGGIIVDGDGFYGDLNGIIGGGLGLGGAFIGGNNIALESTNDLNSVNFLPASGSVAAGVNIDLSDSTVAVNNADPGFYLGGGLFPAINGEISDSNVILTNRAAGSGTVVQATSV